MARPATGKTPVRSVRIPDGVWNAAKERAASEGKTITDVIVAALHRYASAPAPQREQACVPDPEAQPDR